MSKIREWGDLFIEMALGAFKTYRENILDLAKREATALYVRGVKLIRRQCAMLCVLFLCLVILGLGVVLVPLALVAVSSLGSGIKMIAVLVWGFVCMGSAGLVLSHYLSEKKWLKLSGSHEPLDKRVDQD